MSLIFKKYKSPVGTLYMVGEGKFLKALLFEKNWPEYREQVEGLEMGELPILNKTAQQLDQYFSGKRKSFDLPYKLEGTDFQKKVWTALEKIPFGKTRSYKEQGKSIKAEKAARAIGRTNGLNPICIVLPCHRVVGSNGSLTGFAAGINAKKYLLQLEGLKIKNDVIQTQAI